MTNGGKTLTAKLTSHFAGNKVTLFDFQVAQKMNSQFKSTSRFYSDYPYITGSSIVSWQIFLVTAALGYTTYRIFASNFSYDITRPAKAFKAIEPYTLGD
jgi:hypothetical protein